MEYDYFVAFIDHTGTLQSCKLQSEISPEVPGIFANLEQALVDRYGEVKQLKLVRSMPAPRAAVVVKGGSVVSLYSNFKPLTFSLYDLDLLPNDGTAEEQRIRASLIKDGFEEIVTRAEVPNNS